MESKKYSNVQVNIKDIIFVFLPILISVVIQYVVIVGDIIVLFIMNVLSDERSAKTISAATILERDYNQPMNMAFMSVARYLIYGLVFCTWYYKVYVRDNSKGAENKVGEIIKTSCKKTFASIIPLILIIVGYASQLFVDAIMTLVRPIFTEAFAQYDKLVANVVGVYSSPVMLIAVIILAPVAEEFLFRGLVQGYALKSISPMWGIILQGFLFGLYHGNIVQGVYAFVLGTLLGYLAYRYKTLVPGIILHMAINASLLIIPQSLFETTTTTVITAVVTGIVIVAALVVMFKKDKKIVEDNEIV